MSDIDEKLLARLQRLEREVERLQVKERPIVITDHGALTGLGDNDHTQYLLTTAKAVDSDKLDGKDSTEFLLTTAKAADSDRLDGIDSAGYVNTDYTQSIGGVKYFTNIPILPSTNPTAANEAVRKGYADATYLGITAKAADSDKLDNIDSAGFVQTSGDQTISGVKTFNSLPLLSGDTPTSGSHAIRKGYADATYLGISAKAADADKLDGLDSTAFGRPVFLTTPKTSTSWDGDTKTTSDRAIIDLSSVFGVPAGVKAVLISVQTQADTANEYIRFGPNSTYNYALTCRTAVANQIAHASGIVPCDSNGDIYCYVSQGTVENVYVWIWGWWL